MVNWPQPHNWKEVQSFLGFTNFYCHFVEGFSNIAHPLFDLTKKDTPFAWTTDCEAAFQQLRNRITSAPILALLNDRQPFRVKADSSDFASTPPAECYSNSLKRTRSGTQLPSSPKA